jgi:transcriptional regulator with XRE-family HTH domain
VNSSGFAAVVRWYRLAAGLTQEQLAERASMSLRAVGDIERGRTRRPCRQSAQLLGTAFGLSDAELDGFVRSAAGAAGPATAAAGRGVTARAGTGGGYGRAGAPGRFQERTCLTPPSPRSSAAT